MNWYRDQLGENGLTIYETVINLSSSKGDLVKLAYTHRDHNTYFDTDQGDSYQSRVVLKNTKDYIVIQLKVNTDIYSFPTIDKEWHYSKDEERARASKTYNRLVNLLEDLKIDFEDNEMPGPTLHGKIEEEIRFVDIDRSKKTNNRSLEAAKYKPGVDDIRQSLYGPRYLPPTINISNTGGVIHFNGTQT
jgi:hypothetical protein